MQLLTGAGFDLLRFARLPIERENRGNGGAQVFADLTHPLDPDGAQAHVHLLFDRQRRIAAFAGEGLLDQHLLGAGLGDGCDFLVALGLLIESSHNETGHTQN